MVYEPEIRPFDRPSVISFVQGCSSVGRLIVDCRSSAIFFVFVRSGGIEESKGSADLKVTHETAQEKSLISDTHISPMSRFTDKKGLLFKERHSSQQRH